nr:hypothetical protein GCM10020093_067020 [Planobispora longispora]
MTDPQLFLTERVQQALAAAFGPEFSDADPLIRPSQFADYQANVAMSLTKRLGRKNPREVAQEIAERLTGAASRARPRSADPTSPARSRSAAPDSSTSRSTTRGSRGRPPTSWPTRTPAW